jgi:hypothetical protein
MAWWLMAARTRAPEQPVPRCVGKTERGVEVLGSERLLVGVVGHPAHVMLELRHDVDQRVDRAVARTPVQ